MDSIMRYLFFISVSLLIGVSSIAQKADPIKKDTVFRVYLYEKTDTVKMPAMLFKSRFGFAKVSTPGYMIRKGWAEVNSKQFVEQPKVIGGLNRKHKPVTIL
jgi:hypothetical protein